MSEANRKLRVLVVDDQETSRKRAYHSIKQSMFEHGEKLGYSHQDDFEVYQANTPEGGLELLGTEEIDLVILDINFDTRDTSNQDGIDNFLNPVRKQGNKVPIICWSSDLGYRWPSRLKGADEFISKSDLIDLGDAMRVVLRK